MIFGAFVSPGVLLLALLLAAMGVRIVSDIRRRRAATALTYLHQAVKQNLPLPATMEAAALSESGMTASRLDGLRSCLEQGWPLAQAVDVALPEASQRVVELLATAERVGRLPDALSRLLSEDRARRPGDPTTWAFCWAYPIAMLLMLCGILSLNAVFVLPKLKQIFADFHATLPPITLATYEALEMSALPLALFGPVLLLSLATWGLFQILRKSRSRRWAVIDQVAWSLPVSHGMALHRGLADVCQVLADGFDAGLPLDSALAGAGQLDLNAALRSRIRQWADGASQGMAMADAARAAGLPALLVGMLGTAQAAAQPAAACRFLARYYAGRFSRVALMLEGAIIPAMVLLFGTLVGVVAVSMFLPLINLIRVVSAT